MTDFGQRFGDNLRTVREQFGLSQEEVGFRASLHRTEIGMLERGIRVPRIDTLVRVAGAIGVQPGELLEGLEWTPRNATQGGYSVAGVDEASASQID